MIVGAIESNHSARITLHIINGHKDYNLALIPLVDKKNHECGKCSSYLSVVFIILSNYQSTKMTEIKNTRSFSVENPFN